MLVVIHILVESFLDTQQTLIFQTAEQYTLEFLTSTLDTAILIFEQRAVIWR